MVMVVLPAMVGPLVMVLPAMVMAVLPAMVGPLVMAEVPATGMAELPHTAHRKLDLMKQK
jgi:hypothetical protein